MNTIKFGKVKNYDHMAGLGWITPEDGSRDVAVSKAAVKSARLGQICAGQRLGFHVSGGGSNAVNLWATWSNR
ncbi:MULTISPECIES: cold shock domain-containing protein [Pseudovibrio]|uniref:cold shock domain-containing protein n=1 Tax=Stappiaceae TaxID=2821832 RepID=UPI00236727D1|nr:MULTISPECIES: cold shock domain-containing protein [Pseudovibrio]MDD7911587.1 cold shock domain-containing protein [Pseudovibrio exalbescens]MDX5594323.1 cold shock domain-containing protein [Pseudovibrio sp. SPO723]